MIPMLRWVIVSISLLTGPVLMADSSSGDGGPAPPREFDLAAIDGYLSAQVGQAGRVGWSIAIVKDGRVIFAKGYGKRSLQDGRDRKSTRLNSSHSSPSRMPSSA